MSVRSPQEDLPFTLYSQLFLTLVAFGTGCSGSAVSGSAAPSRDATAMFTPASSVPPLVSPPSPEAWRQAMSKTPPPSEGCFEVSQPSTTWVAVRCTTAPEVPYLPATAQGTGVETVGNGGDFSSAVSGTISWAEGSFPRVTGVTSETDGSSDNYSLQLNSNPFSGASLCNGAKSPANCQGWEQFIYAPGFAFMQYWLLNYGNVCPSGWNTYGNNCWQNSASSAYVPTQPIANLANLTLTGVAGATDSVTMSTGNGTLYSASQASVLNLNQGWTTAEFNVVGNGNSSAALFNSGASIVVQTVVGQR